jgi:type I restriction enzyme S subunit
VKAASPAWPTKRLRFLTVRNAGASGGPALDASSQVTFLPMEAIGEQGELDLSLTRPLEEVQSGYSRFKDGDVVVAKITPCFENGKGALIRDTVTGIGFGTTELHVLSPAPELDGRFLYYVTAETRFRRLGEACMTGAAGQQRVPEEFVRDFRIAVPPPPRQRAIADYLDRETARIDALIAAKDRVLGLIAEKRRALTTRVVTRGLDPRAPLRDSGIPWLGEIPAHWETERARWLFRERDMRSETGAEELLTVSHLTGVTLRSEKDVNMFEAETNEGYKLCESGDLVINTLWAWMGAMGVSRISGIVSPAYNVYEPSSRLLPAYIDTLVRLPVFAQEVTRYSKGVWSSRLRLYPEGFFEVTLPVPPLGEQSAIVEHIARETKKLDNVHGATDRTIALLKERRAALIAAAVTGQIDVGRVA